MPAQRTTTSISKGDGGGLSAAEAQARLKQFGPNAVVEEKTHPARELVRKFWAPVPWLLEARSSFRFSRRGCRGFGHRGIAHLQCRPQYLQESHTQKVLALLRQQLRVQARVRRDGAWMTVAAEELVPGDVLHLRQGGIVPADVRIEEGSLLPISRRSPANRRGHRGCGEACLRRSDGAGGEATGVVTATGAGTFFGKTAELVRTADPSIDRSTRSGGGPQSLRRQCRDDRGGDGLRAKTMAFARAHAAFAAGNPACLDSRRAASNLHAHCRPRFGATFQARCTHHAPERLARTSPP